MKSCFTLIVGTCTLVAAGCQPVALMPTTNDGLRREVRDLREEIVALKAQKAQLATLAVETQGATGRDPEVVAATPALVAVSIEPASHFELDERTNTCVARVYVAPSDGVGRFIQLVGSVSLSLFDLSADGSSRTLATARYSPLQVRDAWRGGLMGSHYTFEVPLASDGWSCQGRVTARLQFVDGLSNRRLEAQREVSRQP